MSAPARDTTEYDALRPVAVFLGVSALLNPVLHWVAVSAYPDEIDPLIPRLLLAALCLGGLVGHGVRARPEVVRSIAFAALVGMQVWYLYLGYVNGVSFARSFNALLMVGVGAVVLERVTQLLAFTVLTSIVAAAAYTTSHPAELPQLGFQATLWMMAAAMMVVVRLREQLATLVAVRTEQASALEEEVERRRTAEEAALQASRSKSAFLANMSHELRTPLNAIIGYTELVDEELDDDGLSEDLGRVLTSAQHLLTLIDDVLDLARIEAGRLELRIEPLDLDELVISSVGVVRPAAEAKGLQISITSPGSVQVLGDAQRVRQVLLNLLSNAVKFTDEGQITVELRDEHDHIDVIVSDTGVGIAADELPRLFEAFEQIEGLNNPTGTGLGLAIGRQLAEGMGGSLIASSWPGKGSRFVLGLPRPG